MEKLAAAWARRCATWMPAAAAACLALVPMPSQAAVVSFQGGMLGSGTPAFDADNAPGHDSSGSNAVIRTFDTASYRVSYIVSPQDTGGRLTLRIGATTLPGAYIGPANPQIAAFNVADMPTGSAGCQNIQAAALSAAQITAGTVSGVSADGQTLVCVQPSPVATATQDFMVRISGSAPNGATVAAPTVTYQSAGNAPTSAINPVSGTLVGGSVYGLPVLTVSAAPRWNLKKTAFRAAVFVPGSGPAGEDGYVFSWNLGLYATGSRKGLEALNASAYTISENFNDPDFPNARFLTWNVVQGSGNNINMSPAGQNGCGDWYGQFALGGSGQFDNGLVQVNDRGMTSNATTVYQVARGGTCDATAVDNAAKTATLALANTDFSLAFYPTRRGSPTSAAGLVNPSNADDPANEWWVASKSIGIWAPVSDIPATPSPNTKLLTNTATLNAASVTGQANVDPVPADNSDTRGATRQTAGSLSKVHSAMTNNGVNNPFGLDYAPCDANVSTDCHVNQVAPGQVVVARVAITNAGTSPLPAGQVCDKLDNTRFRLLDTTAAAYVVASPRIKDPQTGLWSYTYLGQAVPLTFELGIANAGVAGGTWTSYNTTTSEYNAPSTASTSAQSAAICGDADATWYSSVAALLAAGHSLQEVTQVRAKYASFPAGSALQVLVPMVANGSYAYSGSDNAPGGAFAAGASTIGALAVNQVRWDSNDATVGVPRTADAVRIFQNEYAKISKSSPSHPVPGQLVPAGSQVSYQLQVNLTTTGSAHASDVTVWDVLPPNMGYVPGSASYGGTPLADPVCAASGLPASLFPTQPLAGGATACAWTIPAQNVAKAATGAVAGNLPVLAFRAGVALGVAGGTQLLNASVATSANNLIALPTYTSSMNGFQCAAGKVCGFSNYGLQVSTPSGLRLQKIIDKATVNVGEVFTTTLTYASVGNSVDGNPRIIDVLPYAGDGRSPATAYTGALQLASFPAAPVADATVTPALSADPGILYYYTRNAPALIPRDGGAPYSGGVGSGLAHDLSGGGGNSAALTVWCKQAQFGAGDCPASLAEVTAVMAVPFGQSNGTLPADQMFAIPLALQPVGNAGGNVYANDFTLADPDQPAAVGSNTVGTRVVGPDLVISKAVSPSAAGAGGTVTFTVGVKNDATGVNAGPFASGTLNVADPMPGGLSAVLPITATGWDCSASTAAAVACSYVGGLPIPIGAAVGGPIEVKATVATSGSLPATLTNTATVATPTSQNTANDSASASVTITPLLQLSKSASAGVGPLAPGSTVTYTVTARNVGVVAADGATLSDPVPGGIAAFSAWSCSASAGSVNPASGSGNLSTTLVSFPVGAVVTCTVTAQVSAAPVGTVINTATLASAQPGAACAPSGSSAPCVAQVFNPPTPLLSLAKSSSGSAGVVAGGSVTYTLVASNTGAVHANGAVIADPLPSTVASWTWTCSAANGAVCPNTSGSGALNEVVAAWPVNGQLTYSLNAVLKSPLAPALAATNSASITPSGATGGVCALPQHASATPPCVASVSDPVLNAVVGITKQVSPAGNVSPGSVLTYTIVVTNGGAAPADGTVVTDALAAQLGNALWSCTAGGGAVCPHTNGNGPFSETIATLPAGGSVVYVVQATVAASVGGTVSNTASVTPPAGGACNPCSATASNTLPVPPSGGGAGGTVEGVPVLPPWGLGLLGLLLAAVARRPIAAREARRGR